VVAYFPARLVSLARAQHQHDLVVRWGDFDPPLVAVAVVADHLEAQDRRPPLLALSWSSTGTMIFCTPLITAPSPDPESMT